MIYHTVATLVILQGVLGVEWERYEGKFCSSSKGSTLEITGWGDGSYSLDDCKQQCLDNPDCAGTMRYASAETKKNKCFLRGATDIDECKDSKNWIMFIMKEECLEQPDGVPCSDDGAKCCGGRCTKGSELGGKGCTMQYESVKGPGAAWSEEDISITRERVFAMISPEEADKLANYYDYPSDEGAFRFKDKPFTGRLGLASVSENTLLRLAFHDCLPYKDGTGGCDGCLNWAGMGFRYKNFRMLGDLEEHKDPFWHYSPEETTHGGNNGLSRMVDALEKIYTTVNWPYTYTGPQPAISLREGGKSRADLWAFAAWVALERTVERANRACDLDYHARQQITLLEGRDKCDIKINKPYKFYYGRSDCEQTDVDYPYKAGKEEKHPDMFGNGDSVVDFVRTNFNLTAADFIALSAVHSAAPTVNRWIMGTKYVWFGNSYLSNMYHKMIAERPTYYWDKGGDNTFGYVDEQSDRAYISGEEGTGYRNVTNNYYTAVGDIHGNPVATRSWRLTCQNNWDLPEAGPCYFRPVEAVDFVGPNKGVMMESCWNGNDEDGNPTVRDDCCGRCTDVWFDENGVQHGSENTKLKTYFRSEDKFGEFGKGFGSNMFALNYEIGFHKKFDIDPEHLRPVGCHNMNMDNPDYAKWIARLQARNEEDEFKSGPDVDCDLNDYAPDGEPLYKITEAFADDHELWAETFLGAFVKMQANGYTDLTPAPQNSWLGYYSLEQQGLATFSDYSDYITENAPLVFTDPEADPYVCGWEGGNTLACGRRWSLSQALGRYQDAAPVDWTP